MELRQFMDLWNEASSTTLGLFWMAFWAFGLGYFISGMIQVFVTEEKMKKTMGEAGIKSVGLGTFFGFISSSCSFAALSTTRALFTKGAGLIPSLAFLLASTNLVIELGIVISVFLTWHFVVGEYLGGLLLIALMAVLVKATLPKKLEEAARKHARKQEKGNEDGSSLNWQQLIMSKRGWLKVFRKYLMEWKMVWKDVTIGFTVAGVIAAFVPKAFFESLFIGSASSEPEFYELFMQALVGPLAAFFTFIGSMGNIPLAAVLFSNGVSFAGIMAFIFSDLVVFPVLRIQAKYYGWKMALYILAVFLLILISSSLLMHYSFLALDILPEATSGKKVTDRDFFRIDHTFYLNLIFIGISCISLVEFFKKGGDKHGSKDSSEKVLFWISMLCFLWLAGGAMITLII